MGRGHLWFCAAWCCTRQQSYRRHMDLHRKLTQSLRIGMITPSHIYISWCQFVFPIGYSCHDCGWLSGIQFANYKCVMRYVVGCNWLNRVVLSHIRVTKRSSVCPSLCVATFIFIYVVIQIQVIYLWNLQHLRPSNVKIEIPSKQKGLVWLYHSS